MPLRLPVGAVTPEVTDQWLALGYRRSGDFVYRAECPGCRECQPTRIDLNRFKMTASMRRVFNRGERDLVCHWGPPQVDTRRIELFNQHRSERGLSQNDEPISAASYQSFLADTCCETAELSIHLDGELVAIAIVDCGVVSTSAVYTHFDPSAARYSLGTYAILKQIQWARQTDRLYVYLGMYVAQNKHLNYKARFKPQQRLESEHWIDHE